MKFTFYKYQGTGNDFILIDNRNLFFPKEDHSFIATLCHRRFGIGADGLILLENHSSLDFEMKYFNSDGKLGSMCGNGGRCAVDFAYSLGIIKPDTFFQAADGPHKAIWNSEAIALKMNDVETITPYHSHLFLDTGSPHHVEEVTDVTHYDVLGKGRTIRNEIYGNSGANVNFVEQMSSTSFKIRTYERGVEAETLSCGTGATAVAIAMHFSHKTDAKKIILETLGGILQVTFQEQNGVYSNIYLEGPAVRVYKGEWL